MNDFNLYQASLDGVKLIEASAGTGKTFTLSGLYVRYIVEKKLTPEQILVLTFTKAATFELKTRLQQQLMQCQSHLNGTAIVDKHKEPELFNLYQRFNTSEQALQSVNLALACFDQASVFTINGFCQRIILDYNKECGSPVFSQLINKKEPIQQTVYEFWRAQQANAPTEFLASIPPLHEVIDKISGLLNKSHYREIKPEYDWQSIQQFYPEFLRLKQQWIAQQDELLDFMLSGVFNANSYSPSKREQYRIEMDGFFLNLNKKNLKFTWEFMQKKLKKGQVIDSIPVFFQDYQRLHQAVFFYYEKSKLGNHIVLSFLYECWKHVTAQLGTLLSENGMYSYDDQIKVVHKAVTTNPRLTALIAEQWQTVMVDEFQDTDAMQLDIFQNCFKEGSHNVIYVGDPKQAIYDFRGADVFVYQQAKTTIHTKNHFNLATNWRSSQLMLNASNLMFAGDNAFKMHWLKFNPSLVKPKHDECYNDIYPPVAVINCPEQQRKQQLANELKRVLNSATLTNQKGQQPIAAKDIAVLVKSNKQAILLYDYLLSQNIAVSLWSESGVFSTTVAQQLYYLIRAINYPSKKHVFTCLHGSFFEVSLNQLQQLDMEIESSRFVNYRINCHKRGLVRVLDELFKDNNVYQGLLQRIDGERVYTDLLQLLELIQTQQDQGKNENQIQEWIATEINQSEQSEQQEERKRRLESDGQKVSIMTLHKSKGLQYACVFIPYADSVKEFTGQGNACLKACVATHNDENQGVIYWKHSNESAALSNNEKQAENIRNLYVAITRAKYQLYLGMDTDLKTFAKLPIASLYANLSTHPELCAEIEGYLSPQEPTAIIKPPELISQEFERTLKKPQSIYSFSSLARKQTIIHENKREPVQELDYSNYFQFPKGAKSGTMQHEILENIEFDTNIETIDKEVKKQLNTYAFEPLWSQCLTHQMHTVITTPLWEQGPSLSQVDTSLVEMEFMLSVGSIGNTAISRWLSTHRKCKTTFQQDNLSGYLSGFIDLIFEYENKFYILDYKSNHLGSNYSDYSRESLQSAIEHHYYDLQYLIYCVALIKFLQINHAGFDYNQHFGGVVYVFIRGMDGKPGNGMYVHKPNIDLIEDMMGAFHVR